MSDGPALDLLVPGDLGTATGGYVYDRRILEGLERLGWRTAVHSLDPSFPRPTPAAVRAAKAVLASLPDGRLVVVDGLALGGLAAALAAEAPRLKLLALVHHPLALETGLDPGTARLLAADERDALAAVRGVIVTSAWTARALGDYGVPFGRLRVVEPGVDPVGAGARLRPPRGRGPVSLLCVATVTPRKGHDVLLDALALLRDRPWHLTCAGSLARDPAYAERVRRQIARLRLAPRVSLLGEVTGEALERCYRRADVFVLASHLEGYGMALADAVARGLPVVSTTAGAIPHT
ncbi:MAG TPA: glycosyltransferase family 4 protein, partial [Gammaproteobacteria bacterium]